ncbi:unnamed protein product [Rhodiola kirilowii]
MPELPPLLGLQTSSQLTQCRRLAAFWSQRKLERSLPVLFPPIQPIRFE